MTVSTLIKLLISSTPDEGGVKHWKLVLLRVESITGMVISLPLFDTTNEGGTSE